MTSVLRRKKRIRIVSKMVSEVRKLQRKKGEGRGPNPELVKGTDLHQGNVAQIINAIRGDRPDQEIRRTIGIDPDPRTSVM